MDISIIGTGSVGQALASGFASAGHDVVFGSRDPSRSPVGGVLAEAPPAAAAAGEVVVLAVPAAAVGDVASELAGALADKPVLDPTNEYPTATAHDAIAERIAAAAPDARVVKAFNTIGANLMGDPVLDGQRVTMFVAGDDGNAVGTVGDLAADLGFDPIVAGDLAAAAYLESLARLWIHLSRTHGRDIGFKLLGG